jgi:hypothetical protein
MTRPAHAIPALLAAAVLAVAGCGDDDSSSSTSPPAARSQEDTGATGTTGPKGAEPAGTTGSAGAKPSAGTGGARPTEPEQRTSGNGTQAGAGAGETAPAPPATEKKKEKPKPDGPQYPASVARELAKQARVVCGAFTLDQLVKQYKPKSRDPKDVAEAYAAGFAVSVRQQVAAGCERGIRESQNN